MQLLTFPADKEDRNYQREPIPAELKDDAEMWRQEMLEKLYSFSNEMMELALAEQPIPADLIRKVLRETTVHMQLQPVLCGSALHGIGVQPVLDAVQYYLPSPVEVPPVEGESVGEKQSKKLTRKPDADEPFCGLVFKVLPAKTGDIHWVRVYSGILKANSRVFNPGKDLKENVAQLWHIHATKKEEQAESALAGDIVGIIGMRQSITGDTICDTRAPILLETIKFPETVISMAIEPESSTERKKLQDTLDMLKRQDPTLQVNSSETGQTLISGMGELHLEIIKNRLLRDFNLNIKFHKPTVSYRESIDHAVEIVGECRRLIAGEQLFAKLRLRMEPAPKSTVPVMLIAAVPEGGLPPEHLTAALDELRALGEGGGRIAGYPLMKLKITVLGGEWNEQTDLRAMKIAAADAFDKGLEQGGKVLLEPIMKLDIVTPEEYLGDFVGDLQQRRALIAKTDQRGKMSTIEAHAPLKELFGYSSAMRSLSQGRAGASIEPLRYDPAPPEVLKAFEI
jgi:elongation factor G